MQDVYKNIQQHNLGKKRKSINIFDDMIADMINNKKLNPVVTELLLEVENWIFVLFYYTILFYNTKTN